MLWNARNGSVRLDGTEMSWVSFGKGTETLILLPGLSDALKTVRGKARLLAPAYRVYFERYTVYMFSRKDVLPDGHTIRDMATDQANAMRLLGIEKADVLGVSEGGMIAQYLAADYPELVEKLVLAVTAPYANELVQENISTWLPMAENGNYKQLMISVVEKGCSPETIERVRRLYPLLGIAPKPKDYSRYFVNVNAIRVFDARTELNRIKCPTLIIGGSDDRTVGVQASYELNELIPGSLIHIYDGLGHAAFEEASDFNSRLLKFFETTPQIMAQH